MRNWVVPGVWLILAATATAQAPEEHVPAAPVEHARTPCSPAVWFEAEGLAWWVTKAPIPVPLVTVGPATGFSGALGQPGTEILYGQKPVNFGTLTGLRMTLGAWIDPQEDFGMEGGGFFLAPRAPRFLATSDATGNPVFAQPVNITGVGERAYASSFPNQFVGSIQVDSWLRLYSWEIDAMARIYRGDYLQWDLLLGFRDLRLSEQLTIESNVIPLVPGAITFLRTPVPANARVLTRDSFGASNDVFVGQLATRVRLAWNQLSADVTAKFGFGAVSESVRIQGGTFVYPTTTALTPTRSAVGGILALPSNIPGADGKARTVAESELTGRLNYDILDGVRLSAGYNLLYVSEVARPGNQIDRTVNPNQVPTDPAFGAFPGQPNRPVFEFHRSTFWAHGITAGIAFLF
jgi:hypothetical protein